MDSRRIIAFVALAWVGSQLLAAAFARSLYGDGGWYVLFHLLTPHRFDDYDIHRSYASFVTQAPLLLGQRLGAGSVAAYAALYSVGTFIVPALLFLVALFLAGTSRLLFAATLAAIVIFGFGVNFINSEVNLFFALVWLSTIVLCLPGRHPLLRGVVLPLLAFTLMRVYEGMLLVGPVLAALAFAVARRTDDPLERIGLVLAILFFLLGVGTGLSGFLAPRDPNNAEGFARSALAFLGSPQAYLLASVVSAAGATVVARSDGALGCALGAVVFAALFLWASYSLNGYYAYTVYYYNRSFLVLVLPVLVAGVAWFSVRGGAPEAMAGRGRAAWLLVPFVAAIAADLLGTYRWHAYTEAFCGVLRQNTPSDAGIAQIKQAGVRTGWVWTHPTLSVLLRDQGSDAMVKNEAAAGWQPFDPGKPITIPYAGLCQQPLVGARTRSTFAVPISFVAGKYPDYVSSIRGMSSPEGWATWSDGKSVDIEFVDDLPQAFDLRIDVAKVFGSNRGAEFSVVAGQVRRTFVVRTEPEQVSVSFDNVGQARKISIEVPKPESPASTVGGADDRRLGIALTALRIVPR